MAEPPPFPAGLREVEFLDAYHASALRKPQVVADSLLRAIVMAGAADRVPLFAVLADQVAEAARRLVHVHEALSDRTYSVARTLAGPLPGAAAWANFAQLAGTLSPEQMVWHLSAGEAALPSAQRLRGREGLGDLTGLIAVYEAGPPSLLMAPPESPRAPQRFLLASASAGAVSLGTDEDEAGNLADMAADLSLIARGFLGAYLHGRATAGRRD